MKYPPWVAGLAFSSVCRLLALSRAQWQPEGVSLWAWAGAVAAGALGMAGAALTQRSGQIRPWSFRAWVIGFAYSLPLLFLSLVFPAGRGEQHPAWVTLPIWMVGGAALGLIMANVQTRKRVNPSSLPE